MVIEVLREHLEKVEPPEKKSEYEIKKHVEDMIEREDTVDIARKKQSKEKEEDRKQKRIIAYTSRVQQQYDEELKQKKLKRFNDINSKMVIGLEKGPKRVRPPTREELRLELSEVEKQLDFCENKFMEYNPKIISDKYRNKQCETDPINYDSKDLDLLKGIEDSFLGESLKIDELDDLIRQEEEEEALKGPQVSKKSEVPLEQKISNLRNELKIEDMKLKNLEALIKNKNNIIVRAQSKQGDLDDLRSEIDEKKPIYENILLSNQEVQNKIDEFQSLHQHKMQEMQQNFDILNEKLSKIENENKRFNKSKNDVDNQISQEDSNRLQYRETLLEIYKKKARYEELVSLIKKAEKDVALEEELFEKEVETKEVIEEQMKEIKSELESEQQGLLEDREMEAMSLEEIGEAIEETISLIKETRVREVKTLEECDGLEANVDTFKKRSGALLLLGKIGSLGFDDEQVETLKECQRESETQLTATLKKNLALKQEMEMVSDMLFLIKENQSVSYNESYLDRRGIKSDIEDDSFMVGEMDSILMKRSR